MSIFVKISVIMKINSSHTTQSTIVAMGARLADAMKQTGEEYFLLNRGVNSVVNINLSQVVKTIDFNSNNIQVYPGAKGKNELRMAINKEYFNEKAEVANILVTGGGISGLDICFQTIEINKVLLPPLFWGTYTQVLKVRNLNYSSYNSYHELYDNAKSLNGVAVVICDPGNPLGEKYSDEKLIELIKELDRNGVIVIFDSPYRRLFYDNSDTFYQQIYELEHVIIVESFSKSLGLSGQRIGFIHNSNSDFIKEAVNRLMYATNGINGFAQVLVSKLINSKEGIDAVKTFKQKTTSDIAKNIKFLQNSGLLATELYKETEPLGIFAVINQSPEKLFEHKIGSVGLNYFVNTPFQGMEKYSRILVSYPNEKFVSFMQSLL